MGNNNHVVVSHKIKSRGPNFAAVWCMFKFSVMISW
jgi:hypothetical protein